jgi:hypothetical protein
VTSRETGGSAGREIAQDLAFAKAIVKPWAQEEGIFIGPLFSESIAGQVNLTRAYFSKFGNGRAQFPDPELQEREIRSYFQDVVKNAPLLKGVAERLTLVSGWDAEGAEWYTHPWFNRFVTIRLPDITPGGTLSYVHWNRLEEISKSQTRGILPMGIHTFVATEQDGSVTELRLRVRRHRGAAVMTQIGSRTLARNNTFLSVSSRVEPQFDRYCLEKQVDPSEPLYRLSQNARNTDIKRPSAFYAATVVRIRLEGSAPDCEAACRRWVGVLAVQALADWRAGCAFCPPQTLSMVEVGDDKYVSTQYIDWIQFLDDSSDSTPDPNADPFGSETGWSIVGAISSSVGFQRLDSAKDLPEVCAPAKVKYGGGIPELAQARLCSTQKLACETVAGCEEIPIHLGSATCVGPNTLACGFPDRGVMLNTSGFQFTIIQADLAGSHSALRIGALSGSQKEMEIPLFPVLLHEVGHWFGLPHIVQSDDETEIMINTGGTDHVCISRAALNMEARAVDQDWPFRLKVTQGLRYAPR